MNDSQNHESFAAHATERPRLRRYLAADRHPHDPALVVLYDKLRLTNAALQLPGWAIGILELFDGKRTLRDVQAIAIQFLGGQIIPFEFFTSLVNHLEQALFLDSPRFHEKLADPIRQPVCIGCYPPEPDAIRTMFDGFFTGANGPGLPSRRTSNDRLRAVLVPHIDYARGGATYAWGFKELFEQTTASLFVVIGTGHYTAHRYTLTRKQFQTPLGTVPTDQDYIDRLVKHYGDGLFDDEISHLPEHSIELEVVFLQYLYQHRRPIRVVPLLVGSFQDSILLGESPSERDDIRRMIAALRQVEEETKEPICYVISGDLAHIGPKFGDRDPVVDSFLSHSRTQDMKLLHAAEAADMLGYFITLAKEDDRRRICGYPPTYTLIEAIRPSRGKLLHYDQYVHPRGFESVSFASMAFYQ